MQDIVTTKKCTSRYGFFEEFSCYIGEKISAINWLFALRACIESYIISLHLIE